MSAKLRALFVNSGILGHASVARMLTDAVARDPAIDATHIDLSRDMSIDERVIRKLMCAGPAPGESTLAALTLARWRHEMHSGVQAARRIADVERKTGHFDVIHFHTQATAYASVDRMRRTPSIASIDITQTLARAELHSRVARWGFGPSIATDDKVFRAAAAITVTSEWAASDLTNRSPELAPRVRVMPYPAVAIDIFEDHLAEQRAHRTSDCLVRVLFLGGDFPRKGGFDLLDVWRDIRHGDRASLDVVTDWPLEPRTLPVGVRHVRNVAAYSEEWRRAWRDADIFVLPTIHESFGIVFQEAAAAGVPVVAPRLSAIPEIVRDGVTGLLYEPGDMAAFARALTTLIDSPDLRYRLGRAARKHIEETRRPERYAEELNALIHEVAGNRG
jgi:alpha-maltose-1-phosphate synthase